MTTKELMLGDYITLADCFDDGKEPLIFKVVGLGYDGENSALVLLNGEKACDIVEIDDEWCGIPITPEILEKNGFEKDDGGEECWGCDAGWVIPDEYDECGKEKSWQVEILGEPNSFSGTIHFVHELQRALLLCGIDKEIEL